ncbi:cytochrome P450 [Infundibulicybe gibba]|nr:cytochrome P450 [Infundibulicybe gibba]
MDLLRNLVDENNVAYRQLTDDELLSNTFMFLLAGHETSAQFEYITTVFHETLRFFPPVAMLYKVVQDVEQFPMKLKAGSVVILDVFGVYLNPIHWGTDCNEFKRERFIDTLEYHWPRVLAFSEGPRGCIGQRFALAESVCILANVVRRYETQIPTRLVSRPCAEQERMRCFGAGGVKAQIPT